MSLEENREDYLRRKYRRKALIRNCENCEYLKIGFYHNVCRVRDKIIEWNIRALFCRYYNK